jgi:hypothetical protein
MTKYLLDSYSMQTAEKTTRENLKLLCYMIGAAIFFGLTLFISFFFVIAVTNATDIPAEIAPNIFMLGLVPPSIGTFLVFTKLVGKYI